MDIYDIADGIGNIIKEALPQDVTVGVNVVPQGIDHQSSLSNYVDLFLHKFTTRYPSLNNFSILYYIGVVVLINAPIDPKRTAQQRAMTIAEMIQVYLGFHESGIKQYCLDNGYHWVDVSEVEADRDNDSFKGSAMFDLVIRQDAELKPKTTIIKFIKELYDHEHGLGGTIELS